MEKRIRYAFSQQLHVAYSCRAFIKEQQEAFLKLKSQANKDRALLWRKLCKINETYGSTLNMTLVTHSSSLPTTSPFKIASSAPSAISPIAIKPFQNASPTSNIQVQKVSVSPAKVSDYIIHWAFLTCSSPLKQQYRHKHQHQHQNQNHNLRKAFQYQPLLMVCRYILRLSFVNICTQGAFSRLMTMTMVARKFQLNTQPRLTPVNPTQKVRNPHTTARITKTFRFRRRRS